MKNKILKTPLILGSLSLLGCTNIDKPKDIREKPNIIIIMNDDMGYSDLGCFGGEINTPNIDSLAYEGLRFTNFNTTGKSFPSRASLLTGLYAYQANAGADWNVPMNDCMTIAEVLKSEGYHTMFSGKWHLYGKPSERGFDRNYGFIDYGIIRSYFDPSIKGPILPWGIDYVKWIKDDTIVKPYKPKDPDFYATDAFTNKAIKWINESKSKESPFFLYLAYNAPHWPLQAPKEDINKYIGRYMKGWDTLRKNRYNRMVKMGIIPKKWPLTPRDKDVDPWHEIEDKKYQDSLMAVYAAMIDRMDWNIGRLRDKLEKIGEADNTLILFFSDNGADPSNRHMKPDKPVGSPYSFDAYGKGWANLSNTPFKGFKTSSYEGGIASPLVAWWPSGIKNPGRISHVQSHLVDIMKTSVDIANALYPEIYNGESIVPLQGKSLAPVFQGNDLKSSRYTFYSRPQGQAVKKGSWKIVRLTGEPWELYNLKDDRTELNNLAKENPEKLNQLKLDYKRWASYSGVPQWDISTRQNITPIKALDANLTQKNSRVLQLKLRNEFNHEMYFKGHLQSENLKFKPEVLIFNIEPKSEYNTNIKISEIKIDSVFQEKVQLKWTNRFINEYNIETGKSSIESGSKMLILD